MYIENAFIVKRWTDRMSNRRRNIDWYLLLFSKCSIAMLIPVEFSLSSFLSRHIFVQSFCLVNENLSKFSSLLLLAFWWTPELMLSSSVSRKLVTYDCTLSCWNDIRLLPRIVRFSPNVAWRQNICTNLNFSQHCENMKIQGGGRPPFWKSKIYNNSVTHRLTRLYMQHGVVRVCLDQLSFLFKWPIFSRLGQSPEAHLWRWQRKSQISLNRSTVKPSYVVIFLTRYYVRHACQGDAVQLEVWTSVWLRHRSQEPGLLQSAGK